ncbi:putative anthocyanidin synthase [Dioscorea sansibarensis]
MQQWPEPVIRVQSLSESGEGTIPERFIKPPSDRVTAEQGQDKTMSIPIIDIGGIANGNKFDEETMKALSNACKEWGFFQLVNHGISKEIIEKAKEVWRGFFHLPMMEKQVYANSPVSYEGYGSRLGVKQNACLDWSDYYFLNIFPKNLRNYEKWPSLPSSLRKTSKKYTKEVVKLCMMLMEMLSLGLGLDKGYFREAFGEHEYGAGLRVCFYPKCPQPELTLGLSSHSDPGGLTVLVADDHVSSLQVRKDGEWVTVKPVPGAVIINIGDQIQRKLKLKVVSFYYSSYFHAKLTKFIMM